MIKKRVGNEPDKVTVALQALLEAKPEAGPSLLEQVGKHLAVIVELRERGHSYGRIADTLQRAGVNVAENTLRLYVGRLRRQASGTRATKPTSDAAIKPTRREAISVPAAIKPADLPPARRGARKGEDMEAWLTAEPDETQI